jgi:hypothetical protein
LRGLDRGFVEGLQDDAEPELTWPGVERRRSVFGPGGVLLMPAISSPTLLGIIAVQTSSAGRLTTGGNAMRERLLRLTLVLTVVAWMLSIGLYATFGSSAMFALALPLTVLTGIIAFTRDRGSASRPALDERELDVLRQAIREKRDVSFVYRAKDGSTTSRRVTPTEIFDVGDTPCLGAFCHLRNGERTFVLDRVGPIKLEGRSLAKESGPHEVR